MIPFIPSNRIDGTRGTRSANCIRRGENEVGAPWATVWRRDRHETLGRHKSNGPRHEKTCARIELSQAFR